MEFDSFLPPLVQRQHQIVLQALLLVLAVANGCGQHNANASHQVLSFLLEQKEGIKGILQQSAAAPSLMQLQESYLIAQLMRVSLASVADGDFVSPSLLSCISINSDGQVALSGFGGLHSALLTLSSVVLSEQEWQTTIQPSSEDEQMDLDRLLPGEGVQCCRDAS